MIPKPPFPRDLTPEQEIAEFERLRPRLAAVWDSLTMREEEPHTSVVVPSLTLDQSELRKIAGASFYEERLLFLLIRLRNPRARMVYVTSQPVHPIILEYYLQFLAGIPGTVGGFVRMNGGAYGGGGVHMTGGMLDRCLHKHLHIKLFGNLFRSLLRIPVLEY